MGTLIKEEFLKSGMTITNFAYKIHTSRTNIYRIFEAKSLNTDLLIIICDVLDYDFFEHLRITE